tara:strand:+ start:1399 stop:2163 length:765 start_codon:yes stop_codon:yes gene_type:complete
MYEITIKHRDKGTRTYNILTKSEADDEKIDYKYWKTADIGDYALTDDDYVALVLQKKIYDANNGTSNHYIRLPFGYAFYNPKYPGKKFKAEGRRSHHTLTGKPQLEVRKGSTKWQNLATAYSACFNFDIAIDLVFDSTTPTERRTYKRWMKTREFKSMVRDELKGLLEEKGYGESDIIDLLTKAQTMAEDKNDVTNFIRVIENIQDMLGMRDKTVTKSTIQIEATETKRLLEEITEEERQLVGKAETVEVKPSE